MGLFDDAAAQRAARKKLSLARLLQRAVVGRPVAAVLVLAAALLLPAFAAAQTPSAPGELWEGFPLAPPTAAVPTATEPGPAPAIETTTQPVEEEMRPVEADASVFDERIAGFLILVGAAVAAAAGFVGHRRVTRREQPDEHVEPRREGVMVRWFERPVPAGNLATGSVAVAQHPAARVEPLSAAALIETLSPQARLDDRVEGGGEHEAYEMCEIACWRGYLTWQFFVESPLEPSLASPYFRAPGKRMPEQTEMSLAARAALVEMLVAAGWEPEGIGDEWFAARFQRARATA
jgi:hypothetical protein